MDEALLFKALSSDSRRQILDSLSEEPNNVDNIAKEVGLRPITIRHHLNALIGAGLVDEVYKKNGRVGRPTSLYKLTDTSIHVTYPKRDYLLLSQIIIGGLRDFFGEDEARKILFEIARKSGVSYVNNLALENGVDKWNLDLFREFFIEKLMSEMGAKPEVLSHKGRELVYQELNCIFFELAKLDKELVCNGLDKGFHDGIIDALGPDFKGERLTCQGHGDSSCSYQIKHKRL